MSNIFNESAYFDAYKDIRNDPHNFSALLETPALVKAIGNVKKKSVLDLGCGFGDLSGALAALDAEQVIGVDISSRMIQAARRENQSESIRYVEMDMMDIASLNTRFDFIVSSLSMHYIKDLKALAKAVSLSLAPGGAFVFSQEHPLTTAPLDGPVFSVSQTSERIRYYNLSDYGASGERTVFLTSGELVKYHRTFSQIFNGVASGPLRVTEVVEPLPDTKTVTAHPALARELHKPSFLIVKAIKE